MTCPSTRRKPVAGRGRSSWLDLLDPKMLLKVIQSGFWEGFFPPHVKQSAGGCSVTGEG